MAYRPEVNPSAVWQDSVRKDRFSSENPGSSFTDRNGHVAVFAEAEDAQEALMEEYELGEHHTNISSERPE